jgi:iron complex outermembrane receptor protein
MSALYAWRLSVAVLASVAVFSSSNIASAQSQDGAVAVPPPNADAGVPPGDAAAVPGQPVAPELAPPPPTGEVEGAPAEPLADVAAEELSEEEDEAAGGPDVMVVTARRREEGLQSAPVAVTALSADDLESRNVEATTGLSQFTPNLQLEGAAALSGSSSNATAFIRGIGQNDFAIFSDPGVGMYVDEVYMGRSIGGVMDVVDLERVEVLRGPQGTLFGRNTIGGAVLLTSKRPTYRPEGMFELTGGSFFRNDIRAMANAPLIDKKLSVRFAVGKLDRDGYGKRLSDGQELGNIHRVSGRAQVLWEPTSNVSVLVSLDGTRAREQSAVASLTAVNPGGPFLTPYNDLVAPGLGITSPSGSNIVDASWVPKNRFRSYGTGPNVSNLDVWGVSATPTWQLSPNVALKSITSYRTLGAKFGRDGDNTPFTFRETAQDVDQWQVSQELQISGDSFSDRLTWMAGIYYFQEEAKENAGAFLAEGLFEALQALPPNMGAPPPYGAFGGSDNPANVGADLVVDIYNKVINRSVAGFANATFKILDNLGLNAGVRVTYDHKEFDLVHQRVASGAFIVPASFEIDPKAWPSFDPRVGLEYQALPNILTYATFSSGYKAGGFNGRPLQGVAEVTTYDPEKLWSYELGVKTDWFKRRFILNAAGFYYDYRDIQLTVNETPRNFVANAAKAQLGGFELEARVEPVRGLRFDAALGYLNAKYNEVGQGLGPTQTLPISKDSKLMKAPTVTLAAGAEYTYALAKGYGSLGARIDYAFRTKVYHDVANTPSIAQDAFGLLGARLSWLAEDEVWNVAAFATNLTNEVYRISGNYSAGFGLAENAYGRPRELGVRLTRRF